MLNALQGAHITAVAAFEEFWFSEDEAGKQVPGRAWAHWALRARTHARTHARAHACPGVEWLPCYLDETTFGTSWLHI